MASPGMGAKSILIRILTIVGVVSISVVSIMEVHFVVVGLVGLLAIRGLGIVIVMRGMGVRPTL